jgi:hypothetical protein
MKTLTELIIDLQKLEAEGKGEYKVVGCDGDQPLIVRTNAREEIEIL